MTAQSLHYAADKAASGLAHIVLELHTFTPDLSDDSAAERGAAGP